MNILYYWKGNETVPDGESTSAARALSFTKTVGGGWFFGCIQNKGSEFHGDRMHSRF